MAIIQRLRRDRFREVEHDYRFPSEPVGAYNEIQHGRYLRLLQKFLGMKGREPSEVTLAAEIAPALPLFHGQENRYLEAWSKFSQGLNTLASVGNFTSQQLRNPAGSNVIALLEQILVGSSGVSTVCFISTGPTTSDLGGVGTALASMDSRDGPRNSTCFSSSSNPAAAVSLGNSSIRVLTPVTQTIPIIAYEDSAIPILPGQGIVVNSGATNVQMVTTFIWRERFLEDSERT